MAGCLFRLILVLITIFPAAVSPAAGDDLPVIRWISSNWIPAWINEGPEKGRGYASRMQRLVQAALPGFRHEERWYSIPRLTRELFEREDSCFSSGFYQWANPETGRSREDIIWSAPVYLFYWHGLTMLAETRARLPEGQELFLADVIADRSLRLGLERGRDYGPALTPVLEAHQDETHLLYSGGDKKQAANQYRLLLRGRVDYLVDYSYMLEYAGRDLGLPDRFVFVPLADHETPYGLGAIICNNSPRGHAVIRALNKALVTLRRTTEFRAINSDWFMIRGREEEYWRLWDQELLSRVE